MCAVVVGGILAGLVSDYTGGRATTCCIMLLFAAPMVSCAPRYFMTKCSLLILKLNISSFLSGSDMLITVTSLKHTHFIFTTTKT